MIQTQKYTAKNGNVLPSYKIVDTEYSNGGSGKLVGCIVTLYAKQLSDGILYFILKSNNGKFWQIESVDGKIKIKGSEFIEVTYHPDLKYYVRSDWSTKKTIICNSMEKLS